MHEPYSSLPCQVAIIQKLYTSIITFMFHVSGVDMTYTSMYKHIYVICMYVCLYVYFIYARILYVDDVVVSPWQFFPPPFNSPFGYSIILYRFCPCVSIPILSGIKEN